MDETVELLRVPPDKWDRYQGAGRKRTSGGFWRPPWIKLHTASSDDYAYTQLSLAERGLLMEMWKLAARMNNEIPNDAKWIGRAIQLEKTTSVQASLTTLLFAGFLQPFTKASRKSHESFTKDSTPEERRERKKSLLQRDQERKAELAAVQEVFARWLLARAKPVRTKLTEGRRDKIKARLRTFPASELIRAIEAVALDPWDERPRYDDLTIIFRSDEQVEKFLALADKQSALVCPECGERQERKWDLNRHRENVHGVHGEAA
ncbi:MAG: hypothetical protein HY323_05345 [Betaproteobacteria bacterium]|nr:hypothetical protein [Betaproteobacteria bacterium]